MKRRASPKEAPTATKRAKREPTEPTRKAPPRAASTKKPTEPVKLAIKKTTTPKTASKAPPKAAPKTPQATPKTTTKKPETKKIDPKKVLPKTSTKTAPTKKGTTVNKLNSPTHLEANPFTKRRKWDEIDVLQVALQASKTESDLPKKIDLDAVLVGTDSPEYKKTQQYKAVLEDIANGDFSHPLIKKIMTKPIPEELEGLPPAAVFKGRLREKQQKEQADINYIENMRKLHVLAGLPLICDIIWSCFSERKKTILPREILESHVLSVHNTPLKKDFLIESIDLVLTLGAPWCFEKDIDQKKWIKFEKDSALYEAAKKKIEAAHTDLKAATLLKY